DLAVEPRFRMLAEPAQAETVPVGGGGRLERADALFDQGVGGRGDVVLQGDHITAIGNPTAHGAFRLPGFDASRICDHRPECLRARYRTGRYPPYMVAIVLVFRPSPASTGPPHERCAHHVVPHRAHDGPAQAGEQPLLRIVAVDRAGDAHIGDRADRADDLEAEQAAHEAPA